MNERDHFVYNGSEFVYLTFGDWKWTYVKKNRASEFRRVWYVGKAHVNEPEVMTINFNDMFMLAHRVDHYDARAWFQKFDKLVSVALSILDGVKPNVRTAVVCDETACLFWKILKQTAETLDKMREFDGIGDLIKNVSGADGVIWCVDDINKENCGNKHWCCSRGKPMWNVRKPIIVPLNCCFLSVFRLSDVVAFWRGALFEKDKVFDEVVVEMMCNV